MQKQEVKRHLEYQASLALRIQNEAGQKLTVLPREDTGLSKNPLLTTQEITLHMVITRWAIPKPD